MNILYIITQADGGGAQKYVLSLAKHFKGSIAAGSEATKLFEDARNQSIPVFKLNHLKRNINPFHDLLAIWEIRDLVKKLQPDIVHLNSSKAGVLGSFACIGLKTKIVFTAHGFVFNEPLPFWLKNFYLALEKVASTYRSFIIAVSEADRKSALEKNLIAPEKISVVHNGITQIVFQAKEDAKKDLGISTDKFIIGTVGNLYLTKGTDILIKAINLLDKQILSKVQFIIVGEGALKSKLQNQINNLNLSENIKLLGNIENIGQKLNAFDLFVLPSRKEGFPFTLLEAMQAGLPIIATNVGGNKEAIGDAGILVPTEDANALADAMQNIISNEALRKNLSQKVLERSKLFTEEKMFLETKKVYEKVLG